MVLRLAIAERARRPALIAGAVAVVAVCLTLAATELLPPAAPAPSPASPLQAADPGIRTVETDGDVLQVYADVHEPKDIADNFDKAGAVVLAVGQALQQGVSDDVKAVKTVRFKFRCEGVNRFQQDVMSPLVTLDVPLSALKAQDYAKATGNDVLGLSAAASLGAPGAYDAAAAWCKDAARSSKALCAKIS